MRGVTFNVSLIFGQTRTFLANYPSHTINKQLCMLSGVCSNIKFIQFHIFAELISAATRTADRTTLRFHGLMNLSRTLSDTITLSLIARIRGYLSFLINDTHNHKYTGV